MSAVGRNWGAAVLIVVSAMFLASSNVWAAPAIKADSDSLDFGKVREGTILDGTFKLRNVGDQPLNLIRVQTGCSCVTLKELPQKTITIAPGGEFDLPVNFNSSGRLGAQQIDVLVTSDDPAMPILQLHVKSVVETTVRVRPPDVRWGRAIRGGPMEAVLRIGAGEKGQPVELVNFTIQDPNIVATNEKKVEEERETLLFHFALKPETPLGSLESKIDATVRIAGVDHAVKVPISGLVLGDVICSPPLIAAMRVPVYPGARISEFTVQPSSQGGAIDVIKTVVTGPLRTEIVRQNGACKVQVFAANDAPAGPQGCLVQIFTTSRDEPIFNAPVYVIMAGPVAVTPERVALDVNAPEAGRTQEVTLRARESLKMRVLKATAESQNVNVEVTTPEQADPEHPAVLAIGIAPGTTLAEPEASFITVQTDQPGGEAVRIPVLLRPAAAK